MHTSIIISPLLAIGCSAAPFPGQTVSIPTAEENTPPQSILKKNANTRYQTQPDRGSAKNIVKFDLKVYVSDIENYGEFTKLDGETKQVGYVPDTTELAKARVKTEYSLNIRS
jgi:hypothetical protein